MFVSGGLEVFHPKRESLKFTLKKIVLRKSADKVNDENEEWQVICVFEESFN